MPGRAARLPTPEGGEGWRGAAAITRRADWVPQPALVAQRNCCRSLTRLCTVVVFLVPVHLSGTEWCGGYRRRDSNPQGRKPRSVSGFCVYQFRHAGTPNTTTNPGKPIDQRHSKPDNSAVPQGQSSYPYPNGCHQFDATMTTVMLNVLLTAEGRNPCSQSFSVTRGRPPRTPPFPGAGSREQSPSPPSPEQGAGSRERSYCSPPNCSPLLGWGGVVGKASVMPIESTAASRSKSVPCHTSESPSRRSCRPPVA